MRACILLEFGPQASLPSRFLKQLILILYIYIKARGNLGVIIQLFLNISTYTPSLLQSDGRAGSPVSLGRSGCGPFCHLYNTFHVYKMRFRLLALHFGIFPERIAFCLIDGSNPRVDDLIPFSIPRTRKMSKACLEFSISDLATSAGIMNSFTSTQMQLLEAENESNPGQPAIFC